MFAQSVWTTYNSENSPLLDNIITAVEEAEENVVWIGTAWGLFSFDGAAWVDYTEAIPHPSVRSITVDSNNEVWVGTLSGAAHYNGVDWTTWNNVNSNINAAVNTIEHVNDTTVWAGTVSGLYRLTTDSWELYLDTSSLEPFVNVSCLTTEGDSLCVGTINGGFAYLYNDQISWHSIPSGMLDNTIVDIVVDDNNNNWLASPSGGIQRQLNDGNWYFYHPEFYPEWPSPDILCLTFSSENSLCAGTNGLGLFGLNTIDNTISYLFTTENSSLVHNRVNDVLIDTDGLYWVATENGLNTWNGELVSDAEEIAVLPFYTLNNNLLVFNSSVNAAIYTIKGQLLHKKRQTKQLNLSGLPASIYLLNVNGTAYKIVKY